jgi:hypothetical protein
VRNASAPWGAESQLSLAVERSGQASGTVRPGLRRILYAVPWTGTAIASRRLPWIAVLLFSGAALMRITLVNMHGLWADEAFSLAIAVSV